MKILIIQDHLRVGGTEKQSLFLARTFGEKGHDAVILTFRPGGHLVDEQHLEGLRVETLQGFDSKVSLWALGLMKRIRKIQPDIILCMGRTANCYAGFIQRRFPSIPVVGTLRTGKMLFPLHHWSMGVVRGVLVNSNWWKRRLLERQFPEERIHVVHNAVLLERSREEWQQAREARRAEFRIQPETCVFLNVATFRPGKRHRELLKVFASMRERHREIDWRLWLVGDGKEYRRCKHWAAANGLGTRVRFFHFQHDPFPFYAAADVAVSVSREDSLPNFLIEAQATGLPVVAYDCRGVNETCIPGETGIIHPAGDREGLSATLENFARDAGLRENYGAGAPAFAKERFSPLPQAESTLQFLEKLANSSP
ncbi:MAG: glycosyltransferase [Puniceicoccaceae bacterium]